VINAILDPLKQSGAFGISSDGSRRRTLASPSPHRLLVIASLISIILQWFLLLLYFIFYFVVSNRQKRVGVPQRSFLTPSCSSPSSPFGHLVLSIICYQLLFIYNYKFPLTNIEFHRATNVF